jgi:hypothetical protein
MGRYEFPYWLKRASFRSARRPCGSGCPRCPAGRSASGLRTTPRTPMIITEASTLPQTRVDSSALQGRGIPTLIVSSPVSAVKRATRRYAMASGHP